MNNQPTKRRQLKKEEVSKLSEKFTKSNSVTFANYHGLSADQMNNLRAKIKEAGGQLMITKNTLLKRALTSYQLPVTSDQLEGPTAVIFAYGDELAPLKELAQNAKTHGVPKFKFGFFGKKYLDAADLETLSIIPGREVLYAQVVAYLNSPIFGFASVLQTNVRNLVSILDQAAKRS